MADPLYEWKSDEHSTLAVPSTFDTKPGFDTPLPSSSGNSDHGDVASAEKGMATLEPEISPRNVHGFKWAFAVSSVLASTFLFALDNTIVADVQPAIIESFGEVNKLPWLSVAFLVAAAGTNLVWSVYLVPDIQLGDSADDIPGERCLLNLMPKFSILSMSSSSRRDRPSAAHPTR